MVKVSEITDALRSIDTKKKHRVFLGFDAFIDLITRPIKKGDSSNIELYFNESGQFGQYLTNRSGLNSSIELDLQKRKIGGNAPNVANALGMLEVKCDCLGPFGKSEIDEIFRPLLQFGNLISTGEPGLGLALEFNDGKLILALNQDVNFQNWERIKTFIQLPSLREIVNQADMLCFLNWSEIPGSTDIFQGLQNDILSSLTDKKSVLVDLSDCSRRSRQDILDMLGVLSQLSSKVILGLNENESRIICETIGVDDALSDENKAQYLRNRLNLHWVVFHNRIRSILATEQGTYLFHTRLNGTPVLRTGAGDNFNAGLCFGYLHHMEPRLCLAIAAMTSGFYVEQGENATLDKLIKYAESMEE